MVNFLPSNKKTWDLIIQNAELTKDDIIYDLGCADGRMVYYLRVLGYNAFGIEKNEKLYNLAIEIGKERGFIEPIIFFGDVVDYNFLNATVVILYQDNLLLDQLKYKLLLIPKVISIGSTVPIFEQYLIKKIDNIVDWNCTYVGFYSTFEEMQNKTLNDVLKDSRAFLETKPFKQENETIYIYKKNEINI